MTPVKISCGICRDLLPLVADGVAAPESEAAVRAHLATCPACRAVWDAESGGDMPSPAPDDAKILRRLRRRIGFWLAGLAAAAVLLAGLIYSGLYGDPVSDAWAQWRALRYAERLFPGQTFTAPDGSWYTQYFNYSVTVQSDQSPDTHFTVEVRKWFWLEDYGTAAYVTDGTTACRRVEKTLSEKAEQKFELLSDLSRLDGQYSVWLCAVPDAASITSFDCAVGPYAAWVYTDAPFDVSILEHVPGALDLTLYWPTAPAESDLQAVLHEAKQVMERSGLPMTYYTVTLVGPDGDKVRSGVAEAEQIE